MAGEEKRTSLQAAPLRLRLSVGWGPWWEALILTLILARTSILLRSPFVVKSTNVCPLLLLTPPPLLSLNPLHPSSTVYCFTTSKHMIRLAPSYLWSDKMELHTCLLFLCPLRYGTVNSIILVPGSDRTCTPVACFIKIWSD